MTPIQGRASQDDDKNNLIMDFSDQIIKDRLIQIKQLGFCITLFILLRSISLYWTPFCCVNFLKKALIFRNCAKIER